MDNKKKIGVEVKPFLCVPVEFFSTLRGVVNFSDTLTIPVKTYPRIAFTAHFGACVDVDVNLFIFIDLLVSKEVYIDQQFDLTTKELVYMTELLGDSRANRIQRVATYYWSLGMSVKEICDALNLQKSSIYQDLDMYKREVLKNIKKDLRANRKILGYMVELMTQVSHQTRVIWDKYNSLDIDAATIREVIREAREARRRDPNYQVTNLAEIVEASKEMRAIHYVQQGYLDLLAKKTALMLDIWSKFGLTGADAINLIQVNGVDVDTKVQEIRMTVMKLVDIVKQEVKDERQRKNIFGRLAKEVVVNEADYREKQDDMKSFAVDVTQEKEF